MDFVTIHTAFNPVDAELVRSRLDAAGFHPAINHDVAARSIDGYALAVGGIKVQVPDDEAADAREFLEAPPGEPAA